MKEKICKRCKKIQNKQTKIALISISIILLVFFAFMFNFPIIANYVTYPIEKVGDKFIEKNFIKISERYQSDPIVQSFANICDNAENKVVCVYEQVDYFYNFVDHDDMNYVKSPEDLLKNGGVCRDWVSTYKAIYDIIGYETKLILEPGHVWLVIYDEYGERYSISQGSGGNYFNLR